MVSILVPFWGLPYRILAISVRLVKPKKGSKMETVGTAQADYCGLRSLLGLMFRASIG